MGDGGLGTEESDSRGILASVLQKALPFILLLAAATCIGQLPLDIKKPAFDTSAPAIAPPWSLEAWFWEDDVNTADAVWDLVNGCKKHNLPLGAVMLDSPWATAYNNFIFDEKRYPNPRGMIADWRKLGIRTVPWIGNVINVYDDKADAAGSDEDLYTAGKERGYFVNNGEAVKWWKGRGALI